MSSKPTNPGRATLSKTLSGVARLPVLTVRQPWAELIIAGLKLVENRPWRFHYRGPLVIAAGQQLDTSPAGKAAICQHWDDICPAFGAGLGVVQLLDVVRVEDLPAELRGSPWATGPWCWVLRNPQPFPKPVDVPRLQKLAYIDRLEVQRLVLAAGGRARDDAQTEAARERESWAAVVQRIKGS